VLLGVCLIVLVTLLLLVVVVAAAAAAAALVKTVFIIYVKPKISIFQPFDQGHMMIHHIHFDLRSRRSLWTLYQVIPT
jgi:hypothetical protein